MIGPIPAIPTIDGEARCGDAPGATAPTRPVWGGYLPAREPPARGPAPGWGDSDEAHAAYAAETAALIAAEASATDWRADTTETRLHLRDGAWYVERPARPCCRAVVIAADAIRDGAEPPPGIWPEEVAKAREILASDDPRAWAWAASGGWSVTAWPMPATEPSEAEEIVSRRGELGCDDIVYGTDVTHLQAPDDANDWRIAACETTESPGRCERNAALIAAAPDLARNLITEAEAHEMTRAALAETEARANEWWETGRKAVDDCMVAAVEMDDAGVPGEEVPERVRWLLTEVGQLRAALAEADQEIAAAWDALGTGPGGALAEAITLLAAGWAERCARVERERDEARAELAAAQDRLTWPRWARVREGGVLELRLPSFVLLAVVWDAYDDVPAGWRAWHGPVGSGPPCPWEQGAGGIEEAEAYLVRHARIRAGCTIRPEATHP